MIKITDIPINTITRPAIYPNHLYISKSGVFSSNRFIGGYAISKSSTRAEYISRCEVIERVIGLAKHSRKVKKFKWPDLSYQSSEIYNPSDYKDSSGLAYHNTFVEASQHAAFELLERHYLTEIWYRNHPIIKFETIKLPNDYEAEFYTLSRDELLPFVITILKNCMRGIWILGSAVCIDFKQAADKSLNECYLLLDNILGFRKGFCNSPDNLQRLFSLGDKQISREREMFLQSKCIKSDVNIKMIFANKFSPHKMNELIFKRKDIISIFLLYQEESNFIVRAHSSYLSKIRKARLTMNDLIIPSDPFC